MFATTRRDAVKLIASSALTMSCPSLIRADEKSKPIRILIDPRIDIAENWEMRNFVGSTIYENVNVDGVPAIRGRGDNSSSGLIQRVELDPVQEPNATWQWRVEQLQPSADIRVTEKEDFGAVIFFLFGELDLLYQGVRSLGYVWTNESVAADRVVHSSRRPDQIRYLVLQSGDNNIGKWVEEKRNLLDDFRRVYDSEPPTEVSAISIFVDNDQTGEAVESLFGCLYVE